MLNIGDRVCSVKDHPYGNTDIVIGSTGIIVHKSYRYGVRWDTTVSHGHSCGQHCESGYGWYVLEKDIELETNDITCGETELLSFLEVSL